MHLFTISFMNTIPKSANDYQIFFDLKLKKLHFVRFLMDLCFAPKIFAFNFHYDYHIIMTEIQMIGSTPSYIDDFLKKNMNKLIEIHDKGIKEQTEGCLGLKCSSEENKMDAFFMNETTIVKMLQKDSWEQLKNNLNGKKLFMINDLDLNSIFLVYI